MKAEELIRPQGVIQKFLGRYDTYRDMMGAVHTTSSLVWTERGKQFIYQLLNYKNVG